MKTVEYTSLSGWPRRIGIGITALALAISFSMPMSVMAKEKKSSSKITSHHKASKKISKKVSEKASKHKHKHSTPTKHTKASHSHTHSHATTHALSKHHKSAKKHASHSSKEHSSHLTWKSSKHAKQAYYVMPKSLRGEVGKPQHRPAYLKPTETSAKTAASGKARSVGTGMASYYSDSFDGHRTASGERFDQGRMTCAHGSLPFGCRIRVTNLRNHKAVEVKVNDRGGFSKRGRMIDLSKAAAKEIGMVATGTAKVKVEVLE